MTSKPDPTEFAADAPVQVDADATDPDLVDPELSESLTSGGGLGEEAEDELAYSVPRAYSPMEYVGVEVVLPSTNPVLILREEDAPHRELHIPIALADGVSIAFAARKVPTPKPLTHELMSNILEGYGLTLEQVRITGVDGSSFSAELLLSGSLGHRVIDCRVTDGVCLALRQRLDVPVTAAEEVLFQASIPAKSS
jgi:bifunctional DNase/RNase